MKSQNPEKEKELLLGLQSGDEASFTALYNLYSPLAFLTVLKFVKEREIALDLIQDLFFRIWNNRQSVDAGKPFKSYLFSIAKNLVIDFFRKTARDRRLMDELITATPASDEQVERAIFRKEIAALVGQTVDSLPAQQRKIFMLCRIDGRSYEEVAKMLHLSIPTIGNQLTRATKKIRRQLLHSSIIQITLVFFAIKFWLP